VCFPPLGAIDAELKSLEIRAGIQNSGECSYEDVTVNEAEVLDRKYRLSKVWDGR
jgi:hypothetical protein